MKILDCINYLRDPKIEKADKVKFIHDEGQTNKIFVDVLKMTYDPFMQFYVKSKFPAFVTNIDQNNIQSFDDMWDKYIIKLLIALNKRSLNTVQITDALTTIMQHMIKEEQEILKAIITKDLRIKFAERSINSALGYELISVPDTQLCKTYENDMVIKNVDGWWASRKLNGLRGRWKEKNGNFVFLTREDYPLIGFDFIAKELKSIQEQHNLTLIDGEVFTMDLNFQEIMSIARNEKNFSPDQKKHLYFNVFNVQKSTPWKNTKEMIDYLNKIFENSTYEFVRPLQYEWVPNNTTAIVNKCVQYTSEGYEGVVLRSPTVSFDPGKRNNNLLKYKLFFEADLEVKDVLYGDHGKKWENSITALYCEGLVRVRKVVNNDQIIYKPAAKDEKYDDAEYVDFKVKVNATCSDWDDNEREQFTNGYKNDPKSIIGRIAEVRFQTVTDKPDENGWYSLQFPVFQKFKDIISK